LGVLGCAADEIGVAPPTDALYYPLGIAAHPDGRYVYVSNAVFDRRYNAGTLAVYDTFERRIVPEATVQIGLFAGEVRVARPAGSEAVIGYTVSRDDNRLWSFSVDRTNAEAHIDCGQTTSNACGGEHAHGTFGTGTFSADPFGLSLDGSGVSVTHLSRGFVSRWGHDSANQETWYRCSGNLPAGATSIARHPVLGWDYVSDRFGARIHMVETRGPAQRLPDDLDSQACELRLRGTLTVDNYTDGGRSRGLAFSADGSLLYVAVSSDRTLRVYDTSVGPTGTPRNRLLGIVPVGTAPSMVRVAGLREGEARADVGLVSGTADAVVDEQGGGLVYVTSISENRVVVVDPQSLSVVGRIKVGAGPHDVAFLPDAQGRLRGYVTAFEDHALSVLDLDPASSSRFTRIATVP
jgi:YVTN family beta-propeller protein